MKSSRGRGAQCCPLKTCQLVPTPPPASAGSPPPLLSRGRRAQGSRERSTPATDGTGVDQTVVNSTGAQMLGPITVFIPLEQRSVGKKLQKGNMNTNNIMTRGCRARWMAHSTVDLVLPWFLGSTCAPSPGAHDIGEGGGSEEESFAALCKGDECTGLF